MPFVFPSATLSKGSRRLQPAVRAKIAADVNTGKLGDTANRNPAETGATTPVLIISLGESDSGTDLQPGQSCGCSASCSSDRSPESLWCHTVYLRQQ
jgi:hypothetical protein